MLKRSAVSDQQQEEQAIFSEAALELDRGLLQEQASGSSSRGMSDTTAKALHRNRKANLGQFLSGAAKKEVISKRKADQSVSEQYYGYQFQ